MFINKPDAVRRSLGDALAFNHCTADLANDTETYWSYSRSGVSGAGNRSRKWRTVKGLTRPIDYDTLV